MNKGLIEKQSHYRRMIPVETIRFRFLASNLIYKHSLTHRRKEIEFQSIFKSRVRISIRIHNPILMYSIHTVSIHKSNANRCRYGSTHLVTNTTTHVLETKQICRSTATRHNKAITEHCLSDRFFTNRLSPRKCERLHHIDFTLLHPIGKSHSL